jgi:hypothetical protein
MNLIPSVIPGRGRKPASPEPITADGAELTCRPVLVSPDLLAVMGSGLFAEFIIGQAEGLTRWRSPGMTVVGVGETQ